MSGLKVCRLGLMSAAAIVLSGYTSQVTAQTIISSTPVIGTSTVVPSTSTAVCPKCGRVHANRSTATVSYTAPTTAAPRAALPSSGGVSNVLAALNGQRARQGLGALSYDPALQAVAQRRAQLMAQTGSKSHPPGSFAPGRYEGVGWNSSFSPAGVSACFTSNPNMRVAGAAMARGRDGVYFCVVYR